MRRTKFLGFILFIMLVVSIGTIASSAKPHATQCSAEPYVTSQNTEALALRSTVKFIQSRIKAVR